MENVRMNEDVQIIWAVSVPHHPEDAPCEIVIGKRDTEFDPYVAWHCFNGNRYSWGAYCSTYNGAMANVIRKVKNEMPFLSEEQAKEYCERYGKEL